MVSIMLRMASSNLSKSDLGTAPPLLKLLLLAPIPAADDDEDEDAAAAAAEGDDAPHMKRLSECLHSPHSTKVT